LSLIIVCSRRIDYTTQSHNKKYTTAIIKNRLALTSLFWTISNCPYRFLSVD